MKDTKKINANETVALELRESVAPEVEELQSLLRGQQQLLVLSAARENFKDQSRDNDNNRDDASSEECAKRRDDYNSINGSGSNSFGKMTAYNKDSQLDIQKFPEEMYFNEQQTAARKTGDLNAGIKHISSTSAIAPTVPSLNSTAASITIPHDEFKGPRIWRDFVENWPIISQPLAILMLFLLIWAIGYILLPNYTTPDTVTMRIAFLFVGAQISGILVTFFLLPDMLGMLFFGVFYANVGLANFTGYEGLEAFLREMALINIMLLAGLGLDWEAFKKLWLMIFRLTLVPTLAEVAIISVLAHFILPMPWLWGILLGLVVTAVSPNVVVTVMLRLKEERLGLNSGIHTLIYAMTTCNDVLAIFVFGVVLGVVFSTGTLLDQILQGPVGIGIGIVYGFIFGLMLVYIPSKNSKYVNELRFVITVLGGTISVMGSKAIGYPSAGALGCVTVAFVAGLGWKRQQLKQHHPNQSSVESRLDLLWKFLKPVSFALIGKEINFAALDGKVVGYGLILVFAGSLFRLVSAFLSTFGGDLTRKERAYITISGFPKATVQAALGPIALDLARSLNVGQESLSLASNILVISVLAIIFTAPLGAILMLRLAPLLLKRAEGDTAKTNKGFDDNEDAYCGDGGGTATITSSQTLIGKSDVMISKDTPNGQNLSYRSNNKTSSDVGFADDRQIV